MCFSFIALFLTDSNCTARKVINTLLTSGLAYSVCAIFKIARFPNSRIKLIKRKA